MWHSSLVIALAFLLFPVAAWADILLDSGRMTLNVSGSTIRSLGLNASGPNFAVGGIGNVGLGFSAPGCGPCLPGSVYFPGGGGSGPDFGGVTYFGTFYPGSEVGEPGSAFISWSAGASSGISLPPLAASFSATAPFSILVTARLNIPTFPTVQAIGQGIATFSFVPDPIGGQGWWISSGVFDIQPIPEPGTWLLVSTALGLIFVTRNGLNQLLSRRGSRDGTQNQRRATGAASGTLYVVSAASILLAACLLTGCIGPSVNLQHCTLDQTQVGPNLPLCKPTWWPPALYLPA